MGRETNKQRRAAQAQSAREKAAAARSQQRRADQRRRATVILSTIVAVAVVAGVIVAVVVTRPSHTAKIANNRADAPASVVDAIRSVPESTFKTVGLGSAISAPKPITDTPLQQNGKPELLYIGAEFCPYCAGERWSMAVALSRFGTLDNVKLTQSASNDVDPNTHTLDFIDTSYTSKYLSFTPVENEDRDHNQLQKVTDAQDALWGKHSANGQRGYPFLDIGGKYVVTGPTFDPKVLAGLTQTEIASKLADPNDPVAKGILGGANVLTAALCGITNNQPANVCSSSTISGIQKQIDSQQPQASSSSGPSSSS